MKEQELQLFKPLIKDKITIYKRPNGFYIHEPGGEFEKLTFDRLKKLHKELWEGVTE